MSLSTLKSYAPLGLDAVPVSVEVHVSAGLPRFSIVGLPEATVRESKERVRSALINSHFKFPNRRITVNLAPAELPKEGGRFDLAIAIGILVASQQLSSQSFQVFAFIGELALSGELKPTTNILSCALKAQEEKMSLILPTRNAYEASFAEHLVLLQAHHLLEVYSHLQCQSVSTPSQPSNDRLAHPISPNPLSTYQRESRQEIILPPKHSFNLDDVKGQNEAKIALTVAAAGQHNMLMTGSPGTGKSMLAQCLPMLLPNLSPLQSLELRRVQNTYDQKIRYTSLQQPPFRMPHHSISSVALIGGGYPMRPGEISLAHHGVLFLDELPEFSRRSLEALREPLQQGCISIARAAYRCTFPTKFQLIAAMNPCPCGYYDDPQGRCRCSAQAIQRYQNKLSGPLLDRIDLHVKLNRVSSVVITSTQSSADKTLRHEEIKKNILRARERQNQRQGKLNSHLSASEIMQWTTPLSSCIQSWLHAAIDTLRLSMRSYHNLLRVARTLADLDEKDEINQKHIEKSLSYTQASIFSKVEF